MKAILKLFSRGTHCLPRVLNYYNTQTNNMKIFISKKIITGLLLGLSFLSLNAQQIKINLPQKEEISQDVMLLGKSSPMSKDINSNNDREHQISEIERIIDPANAGKDAENTAKFIADDMDWELLYHTESWNKVIAVWVNLHTRELKDILRFKEDFDKISNKINDPVQYKDFTLKTADHLLKGGMESIINIIAEDVRNSGKITDYSGVLAYYLKGAPGTQAPDLIIKNDKMNSILKIRELADKNSTKTMLLFYASGCGPCENLLEKLPGHYENIKAKGVKIIAVSADQDEKIFKDKAKDFLWKDVFCDYEGFRGINFRNYGVSGTPTIFLLDNTGKILLRTASLEEILGYLK